MAAIPARHRSPSSALADSPAVVESSGAEVHTRLGHHATPDVVLTGEPFILALVAGASVAQPADLGLRVRCDVSAPGLVDDDQAVSTLPGKPLGSHANRLAAITIFRHGADRRRDRTVSRAERQLTCNELPPERWRIPHA